MLFKLIICFVLNRDCSCWKCCCY